MVYWLRTRSVRHRRRRAAEPSYAAPKPTVDEILALGDRLQRTGVDFLKIDVAIALTFAGIALQTADPVKRLRNRQSARKAYDSVLKLLNRVALTHGDAQIMAHNLQRLRSELVSLGEDIKESEDSALKRMA